MTGAASRVVATFVAASVACALVAGCASPNPGVKPADALLKDRDCVAAARLVEPAAQRGEPWAQFRLGFALSDANCRTKVPSDTDTAINWFRRAACFEPRTDWERGVDSGSGPPGLFDARRAATRAAMALAEIYSRSKRPEIARFYVERARNLYTSSDEEYTSLTEMLSWTYASMSDESLKELLQHRVDLCAGARP